MASESNLRVLLTGANGFIGRAIVPLLLEKGVEVLALSTDPQQVSSRWGVEAVDALSERRDVAEDLIASFRPSVLLHLAWSGLPDYSSNTCLANVEFSTRVIRIALASGISRVVGVGSCWEYGNLSGSLEEEMETTPTSVFTQAKSCIRHLMTTSAEEHGVVARWGRLFYVYGHGQRETSLIPTAIRAWQAGRRPILQNTQGGIDLVHIDDVAKGLVALSLENGPPGIFNIGSGHAAKVTEVVETVRAIVNLEEPESTELETNGGDMSWANINKMKATFGWEPTVSLSVGIKKTLDGKTLL